MADTEGPRLPKWFIENSEQSLFEVGFPVKSQETPNNSDRFGKKVIVESLPRGDGWVKSMFEEQIMTEADMRDLEKLCEESTDGYVRIRTDIALKLSALRSTESVAKAQSQTVTLTEERTFASKLRGSAAYLRANYKDLYDADSEAIAKNLEECAAFIESTHPCRFQ